MFIYRQLAVIKRSDIYRVVIKIRNPEVIQRVHNSSEALADAWSKAIGSEITTLEYLKKVLIKSGLGIEDATEEEIQKLKDWKSSGKTVIDLSYIFADMVSRRALIGVSIFVC